MTMNRTSERAFENAIEDVLLASGFQRHLSKEFDRENAIFPTVALKFIQTTQPKIWDKLELLHGEKRKNLNNRNSISRDGIQYVAEY